MVVPAWIKIIYTLFVAILVPFYWHQYGPQNFLWVSDIALFATLLAIWLGSRLLASMMAIAALLPEILWTADFFGRLLVGPEMLPGLGTRYMFNAEIPLLIRGLSLFHVALPVLLVWLVSQFGYDRRACLYQTFLAWLVLLTTYLVTEPSANINWVYGFGGEPQTWMPAPLYLVLLMICTPLLIYWPTHFALSKMFNRPLASPTDRITMQ